MGVTRGLRRRHHLIKVIVQLGSKFIDDTDHFACQASALLLELAELTLLTRKKGYNERRKGSCRISAKSTVPNRVTHLRTSKPASPNLRAAKFINGKERIVTTGVRNVAVHEKLDLMATKVAIAA